MEERLKKITRIIIEKGFATPEELAASVKVAAITVRRDLILLEKRGTIKRVHGGAVPLSETRNIQHINQRLEENIEAKKKIARYAASLIEPGRTVFVDAGSTCCYLAEILPKDKNITVISHSLDVINIIRNRTGVNLIGIGGEYNDALNAFVGPIAESNLRSFNAELSFIGASSVDIKQGSTNNTPAEKIIKNIMNDQSARGYILADAEKFGKVSTYQSIPIDSIKNIITDDTLPAKTAEEFRKKGVLVIKAK
jgi:DeoR family transcriptional regulator, fructose operon transcriptional repressor